MKSFISRLTPLGLILASLIVAGCGTSGSLESLGHAGSGKNNSTNTSETGDAQASLEAARFNVGDNVSVIFSGIPDPIEPHEEIIKEDGNVTLPLIGSVKAVGCTAGELQKKIHDLYVPKYYVRLNIVVKPGDLVYYVRGEVKQPGRQLYVGKTTVTKAITSASDFTDFAGHKVWLIRSNGTRIKVNVDKALEDPALDPPVYPGDQVVVPRRLF